MIDDILSIEKTENKIKYIDTWKWSLVNIRSWDIRKGMSERVGSEKWQENIAVEWKEPSWIGSVSSAVYSLHLLLF